MSENNGNLDNLSKKYSSKTDEWLVQMFQQGDKEDKKLVAILLEIRYRNYLRKIVGDVSSNWLLTEDVIQDAWFRFYKYVGSGKKIGNTKYVLSKMTRNTRDSTFKKLTYERKFEADIPIMECNNSTVDTEDILERKLHQFIYQLPLDAPITDCQRMVFILRGFYEFPSKLVGRLLGKSITTVDSHFDAAKKSIKKYLRLNEKLDFFPQYSQASNILFILEKPAIPFIPKLDQEELKYLEINQDDYQANYYACFFWPNLSVTEMKAEKPQLILVRKNPPPRNPKTPSQAWYAHLKLNGEPKGRNYEIEFDGEKLLFSPSGFHKILHKEARENLNLKEIPENGRRSLGYYSKKPIGLLSSHSLTRTGQRKLLKTVNHESILFAIKNSSISRYYRGLYNNDMGPFSPDYEERL